MCLISKELKNSTWNLRGFGFPIFISTTSKLLINLLNSEHLISEKKKHLEIRDLHLKKLPLKFWQVVRRKHIIAKNASCEK